MKKKLRLTRYSPAYWRVTIDNPPLNLIDPDMLHELQDLINQFEAANELKVVVFDSANPEFYIAHVDISQISPDVGPTGLRLLPDFMQRLSCHLCIMSGTGGKMNWITMKHIHRVNGFKENLSRI